jgi:hypothetical protein
MMHTCELCRLAQFTVAHSWCYKVYDQDAMQQMLYVTQHSVALGHSTARC